MVDKVALGHVFSEYLGFLCQSSFHQFLHNYHHLSCGAGSGRSTKRLSLTPLRIILKKYCHDVTFLYEESGVWSMYVCSGERENIRKQESPKEKKKNYKMARINMEERKICFILTFLFIFSHPLLICYSSSSSVSLSCVHHGSPFSSCCHVCFQNLRLMNGSLSYHYWQRPGVIRLTKVYIYNVTNPDGFLNNAERPKLTEIGPFVYR
jgi:hypothetical protein